jgi:hypothetical protein
MLCFEACNKTDPWRDGLPPAVRSHATEHLLALAVSASGIRVYKLLALAAPTDSGHAAEVGIDRVGFWHETDPRYVLAWRYLPWLIWRPLYAAAKFLHLGNE